MELLARFHVDSGGQRARLSLFHLDVADSHGIILYLEHRGSAIWLLLRELGDFHIQCLPCYRTLLLIAKPPGVLAAVVRYSVDVLGLLWFLAQPALLHQRRHPLVHLEVRKAWYSPHRLPQRLVRLLPGRDWAGLCSSSLRLGNRLLRHVWAEGGSSGGF